DVQAKIAERLDVGRKQARLGDLADLDLLGEALLCGLNIGSAAYWHKAFPYKSTLTGVSGNELADGYETASGKQWTQQL
ncbi:hypothetical protein ACC740_38535, partial [Rhizobium ruizarguesonis]